MGGLPTGGNFSFGSPNLADTSCIDWPLEGRSRPDGVFGGALVMASISRVSAFTEVTAMDKHNANISRER